MRNIIKKIKRSQERKKEQERILKGAQRKSFLGIATRWSFTNPKKFK